METIEKHTLSRSPLREVVAFISVAYSLALALALAIPDAGINVLLSALLPTVAVTILTFTMFRRGSRRQLWRGIGLNRAGVRTWPSALGIPLLLCGGAFGTALLTGAGQLRPLHVTGFTAGSFAVNTLLNFTLMMVILVGEEIGWRGFMLPRVQMLTSKRRAAVVTGFVHGLFHMPLVLIATTYDADGSRWIVAPVTVLTITAAGVFYAWLWDRSGSPWAVTVGHSAANLTFDFGFTAIASTTPASLAYVAGETGFATLGACVVLAALLLTRARVWQRPAAAAEQATRPEKVVVAA
jgi:CAAX protease family protein